jgi:hypothetical protein
LIRAESIQRGQGPVNPPTKKHKLQRKRIVSGFRAGVMFGSAIRKDVLERDGKRTDSKEAATSRGIENRTAIDLTAG